MVSYGNRAAMSCVVIVQAITDLSQMQRKLQVSQDRWLAERRADKEFYCCEEGRDSDFLLRRGVMPFPFLEA